MRRLIQISAFACTLPLMSIGSFATAAASTVTPFDLKHTCNGGGTRESTGSWDSASGALTFTTTLTNCVDGSATTHNGTVGVSGTLLTTTAGYSIDATYQFNTHYVSSTDDVQRACTWHKVGSYERATHKFTGTVTKTNCTLTETDTEGGDIVEHLQKLTHQTE